MTRALLLFAGVAMAGPAVAYTLTLGASPVGDRPSSFEGYALQDSQLVLKPMVSHLVPKAPMSSLGVSQTESALREKAQATLTSLGARREGSKIIVTLPGDVLFDFDKSDIRADARPVLAQLSEVLLDMPDAPVEIVGHTDAKGSDEYNLALSERRALSVRDWLSGLGVAENRLSTRGMGETDPVAPNAGNEGNDYPEGRQMNRRVEFIISSEE